MRKFSLPTLTAICVASVSISVSAVTISAGLAEVTSLLYIDTNRVVAGTIGGGIFTSQDQGNNWARPATSPNCSVRSLAKASTTIVYAASDCGIFKSTDSAASWVKLSAQPARSIAVSPANASIVLVGVTGIGVLRSADAGATFVEASTGLDSTDVRSIAFDPSNASNVYVALFNPDWYPPNPAAPLNLGGVFRSTDGGTSWVSANTATLNSRWVTSIAVNTSGVVFATTAPPTNPSSGGVQRRNVGTGAWESHSIILPSESSVYGAYTVVIDPNGIDAWVGSDALGPYVWKQSNNELRRQMDGSFATDGPVLNKVTAIAVSSGSTTVIGVAGLGVYTSVATNPANSLRGYSPWVRPTTPIKADRVRSFVRSPTNNDAYVGVAGAGVWRAISNTTNYNAFNTGFAHPSGVPNVAATPTVSFVASTATGDIYAAVTGRGVLKSASGSSNWAVTTTNNWQASGLAGAPSGGDMFAAEFFASGTPGVLKITSAGATSLVVSGWQNGAGMGRIVRSNSNLQKTYALAVDSAGTGSGTNSVGAVIASNGTVSAMVPTHVGFQRLGFYALADNSNTVLAASLKGLFRSVDGGSTFGRVTTSGLPASGIAGLTMVNGLFFAATKNGNAYCSTDSGNTWQSKYIGTSLAVDIVSDGGLPLLLTDGAGMQSLTATCP